MRNTRLFTAGGIVILLLVVFLIQLGCGGEAPTEKTDDTTKDTAADTAKPDDTTEEPEAVAAVYVCPMGCTDETFTDPDAKCPVCGMALELQAEEVGDDGDEEEGEDDEEAEEDDPHAGHGHG